MAAPIIIPGMDDVAVGRIIRILRHRRGWRQSDLAARAGCSQGLIAALEAGNVEATTLRTIRSVLVTLDVRVAIELRGRGAELERLLDEDHARLVAVAAARLERSGWVVDLEVTYSEWGERGSIDILAMQPAGRAALVVEVKTEIGSAELIGRKLDEKSRLAPRIVERTHGSRPAVVGRALVVPERGRLRRTLGATPALRRMLPDDPSRIRGWLRAPTAPLAVVWFLPDISPGDRRRPTGRRIRVPDGALLADSRTPCVRPPVSRGCRPPPHVASPHTISLADERRRTGLGAGLRSARLMSGGEPRSGARLHQPG